MSASLFANQTHGFPEWSPARLLVFGEPLWARQVACRLWVCAFHWQALCPEARAPLGLGASLSRGVVDTPLPPSVLISAGLFAGAGPFWVLEGTSPLPEFHWPSSRCSPVPSALVPSASALLVPENINLLVFFYYYYHHHHHYRLKGSDLEEAVSSPAFPSFSITPLRKCPRSERCNVNCQPHGITVLALLSVSFPSFTPNRLYSW